MGPVLLIALLCFCSIVELLLTSYKEHLSIFPFMCRVMHLRPKMAQ